MICQRAAALAVSALASALLASGCGFDRSGIVEQDQPLDGAGEDRAIGFDTGTSVDTTSVTDTTVTSPDSDDGVVDTTPPTETSTADTSTGDTSTADTSTADTGPTDTGPTDTGPADTGPADTGPADTGKPDTPPTGSLTGSGVQLSSASCPIDLTSEGSLDWGHWGYSGDLSWDHKATGSLLTPGSATSPTRYASYPCGFTWSDGAAPNPSVTNTHSGIYFSSSGDNLTFNAGADDKVARTLRLYLTWNGSTGNVKAHLSDSSATDWTAALPPPGATGSGIQTALYTITYRSATKPQNLVITVTQTSGAGFVSLLSASLK